jgi:hypothetical protein
MWGIAAFVSEHRVDIRFEGGIELLGRDVQDRFLRHLARGIAHENIEAAQLTHRVRYQSVAKRFLAKIAGQRHRFASCFPNERNYVLGVGFLLR